MQNTFAVVCSGPGDPIFETRKLGNQDSGFGLTGIVYNSHTHLYIYIIYSTIYILYKHVHILKKNLVLESVD